MTSSYTLAQVPAGRPSALGNRVPSAHDPCPSCLPLWHASTSSRSSLTGLRRWPSEWLLMRSSAADRMLYFQKITSPAPFDPRLPLRSKPNSNSFCRPRYQHRAHSTSLCWRAYLSVLGPLLAPRSGRVLSSSERQSALFPLPWVFAAWTLFSLHSFFVRHLLAPQHNTGPPVRLQVSLLFIPFMAPRKL